MACWDGVVGMFTGVPWRVRGFEFPRLPAVLFLPFVAWLEDTLERDLFFSGYSFPPRLRIPEINLLIFCFSKILVATLISLLWYK